MFLVEETKIYTEFWIHISEKKPIWKTLVVHIFRETSMDPVLLCTENMLDS